MRTHIKNIVIFFHPMAGMQVASGKFSTATGEAEVTRLESEVSFLQVKATMSLEGAHKTSQGGDLQQSTPDSACQAREFGRSRKSLQPDAGVRERSPDKEEWGHGVRHEVSTGGGGAAPTH